MVDLAQKTLRGKHKQTNRQHSTGANTETSLVSGRSFVFLSKQSHTQSYSFCVLLFFLSVYFGEVLEKVKSKRKRKCLLLFFCFSCCSHSYFELWHSTALVSSSWWWRWKWEKLFLPTKVTDLRQKPEESEKEKNAQFLFATTATKRLQPASQPKRKEQTLIYFDLLSALPVAATAQAAVLVCHNLIKCHFKNKTGHRNREREGDWRLCSWAVFFLFLACFTVDGRRRERKEKTLISASDLFPHFFAFFPFFFCRRYNVIMK